MKPFWCVNVTDNNDNDEIDGKEFMVSEISEEDYDRILKKEEELEKAKEKAKCPGWFGIAKIACYAGLALIMLFLIFRKDKMPLAETFDKNPLLAVVCVLLCVGYVVMRFFEKSLRQKSYNDADLDERVENAKKELDAAYESIGVPVKAGTADMLIFDYTVEDGRIVPKKNKHSAAPYMICEVRLYQKDGKLFLFDSESVFAFESNEVKEILTVDETVSIEFWGRRGEIDKVKKYKVNGIEADKEGIVSIDRYHILRVEREGREYGLYFPSYELSALERWLAYEA